MPRLLLVDDNPSIHKIAETLLAGSDVALVCAASGAEALSTLESNGPFDVALLDISMMGMDGWELLARIRKQESTARMPVGMMAGVLDVVDPERLRQAPIQGFFKKPVELRDLAARVKLLLETPVEPPAPEPAEVPPHEQAADFSPEAFEDQEPITEILDAPAPFAEPEAAPEDSPTPSPYRTVPALKALGPMGRAETHPDAPDAEDLLQLGPEDLLLEEEPVLDPGDEPVLETGEEPVLETGEEPVLETGEDLGPDEAARLLEESLDLEELDMESLRNLTQPGDGEAPEPPSAPQEDMASVPDFSAEDTLAFLPGDLASEEEDTAVEFPDLFHDAETAHGQSPAPDPEQPGTGSGPMDPEAAAEAPLSLEPEPAPLAGAGETLQEFGEPPAPEPPSAATPEDFLDWTDESETLLEAMPAALDAAVPPPLDEVPLDAVTLDLDAAEPPAASTPITLSDILDPGPPMAAPLAEALPAPMEEAAQASAGPVGQDPLAALLADPVLMDRLAKAVVSRLGDQTLREIAWEVMPELADRFHRN